MTAHVHPAPPADAAGADCRCLCGSLLARVVGDAVELKCRRCKRTVLVPLAGRAHRAPGAAGGLPSRRVG